MILQTLHEIQLLPVSIHEAWHFFSDPQNLCDITPPSLNFKMTTALPAKIHPGMIITYRIKPLFNVSRQWITEITHVLEPHLFVDEQRFGPYRFWHHQHLFREIEGGVEMRDIVHYALPYGVIGRMAAARLVRRKLHHIFAFRREVLTKRFGTLSR